MSSEKTFLELKQSGMETLGFWDENYKTVLLMMVERGYKRHIVKEFAITDVVIHGDKVLLKWEKRLFPLSDDQLKEYRP